jgi:hypothetical protein
MMGRAGFGVVARYGYAISMRGVVLTKPSRKSLALHVDE